MKKITIQIASGKGSAECCRAVAYVQELMMKQALRERRLSDRGIGPRVVPVIAKYDRKKYYSFFSYFAKKYWMVFNMQSK